MTQTHPYELYLHLNDIEHSRTKVAKPRTNGTTEKLNQTILDDFYKVAFRKKIYTNLDDIQADLDEYMNGYNTNRTNQGKRCQGRTPMQTLMDSIPLYQQYVVDGAEKLSMENNQVMN